ncbi:pyridoxamine 5'-phosphate oxidase [Rhodococcus sp. HNM0569]|uniref:pyridoxamine 5'-phosphate oxidase n=1 Tax=Rhodococcus sp. HNM0569 TaxID=2716340 RepID=UPI00146C4511|nr:pyridoxamine 5'-phosphate oxidase [Rhodococcus sp. HNM0569]NLU82445.1 pyridoxamine 5'-phosphate oxidase [Rhodococcus sp. HNM0569]
MRVAYSEQGAGRAEEPDLDVVHVADGWLPLVRIWMGAAVEAGLAEPNAMVLATVDDEGRPASRTVLCKGLSEDGVLLFTNYESDKGRQLEHNPYASATFAWIEQAHQVTVRGRAERVAADVTSEYWRSRPRGSQLGAWASHQSQPIDSRVALDAQLTDTATRFGTGEIPVPPHWGGILIRPFSVEFWQGRADRLHNRVRTELVDGRWVARRLQP